MGWTGDAPPFFPDASHTQEERNQFNPILPDKLFLTNFRGAENAAELRRIGCTHIAAVGAEFMDNKENHAASSLKVKFWNKDITDDEHEGKSMKTCLRDAAAFINKAIQPAKKKKKGGVVVVHCAAGISRSATVVLGYLVIYRRMTLRDAFAHLLERRPCCWPNEGFMEALIELEKEERKGKQATIDLAEYEHWGDYDGPAPEADDDDPHHHGLTKEARHAAAVAATEEAIREHQQRERTSGHGGDQGGAPARGAPSPLRLLAKGGERLRAATRLLGATKRLIPPIISNNIGRRFSRVQPDAP